MTYTLIIYIAIIAFVVLVTLGKLKPSWWLVYLIMLGVILPITTHSNYLIGTDVHLEYYFARQSFLHGWNISYPNPNNSAIGITLITPFLAKLGIPIEITFKWLAPALFSLTPAILYQMYKRFVSEKEAFLSIFYFIAIPTIIMEIPAITREMMASPFLAIFLFAIISKLPVKYKLPLMLASGLSTILLHYSLGIVLLAILTLYLIAMGIFKLAKKEGFTPLWVSGLTLFILGISAMFYYNSVANGTPLRYVTALIPVKETKIGFLTIGWLSPKETGINYGIPQDEVTYRRNGIMPQPTTSDNPNGWIEGIGEPHLYLAPNDLLISYDSVMRTAIGLDFMEVGTVGKVFRVLQIGTELLILIGLIFFLVRFRLLKFSLEYLALALVSGCLLLLCFVLPGFSSILNATRWYHIALFILSPMVVIGVKGLMRVKEV